MATDIIEIEKTEILLKNIKKFPDLEQFIEENNGNVPSFIFEEELFTHEEFKEHLKKRAYERLGIKLNLP